MASNSAGQSDDDVVVNVGVNLDPVAEGMKKAGPKIQGQAERFGETLAERMGRGLSKMEAITEKAMDRVAAVMDRVKAKQAFGKLSPDMKMMSREFDKFDRDMQAHTRRVVAQEQRLAREQERAIRQRAQIVARAEREASQHRLEAIISTSDRINGLASMLPRRGQFGAQMGAMIGRAGGPAGMAAGAFVGAGVGLGADATVGVASYATNQVPLASRIEQSTLKFKVVFGEFAKTVQDEVDKFAEKTGRSRYQLRSDAADVMGMLDGMGINKKQASSMAARLSTLSVDLSSFHNIGQDEIMTKLMSGLSGELEPVRRLGVDLREANVEAKALSMGLAKTKEGLTQTQKVQARYALILEGTKRAHGDAERSMSSYESSQKQLEAAMEMLNVGIGTALIPTVKELNSAMTDLARGITLTEEEAKNLGPKVLEMMKDFVRIIEEYTGVGISKITERARYDFNSWKANATAEGRDERLSPESADAFRFYRDRMGPGDYERMTKAGGRIRELTALEDAGATQFSPNEKTDPESFKRYNELMSRYRKRKNDFDEAYARHQKSPRVDELRERSYGIGVELDSIRESIHAERVTAAQKGMAIEKAAQEKETAIRINKEARDTFAASKGNSAADRRAAVMAFRAKQHAARFAAANPSFASGIASITSPLQGAASGMDRSFISTEDSIAANSADMRSQLFDRARDFMRMISKVQPRMFGRGREFQAGMGIGDRLAMDPIGSISDQNRPRGRFAALMSDKAGASQQGPATLASQISTIESRLKGAAQTTDGSHQVGQAALDAEKAKEVPMLEKGAKAVGARIGAFLRGVKTMGAGVFERVGAAAKTGGGEFLGAEEMSKFIQQNIFKAADERRKKAVEDATVKMARATDRISDATESTVKEIRSLPAKIGKYMGYGR